MKQKYEYCLVANQYKDKFIDHEDAIEEEIPILDKTEPNFNTYDPDIDRGFAPLFKSATSPESRS
jgi:hypothetical protein